MPEEWPGQAELHSRLKKLDGISSSKIAVIAKFAVKSVKHYKFVVHAVEHHMKHGNGKARLQGMCIIDAILRSAAEEIPRDKDPYPSRFSKNMAFTLGLAAACTDADRGKIVRIVKIWVSAKLLPENCRREINEWLLKNDPGVAGAVGEPISRLLSSIDKLKEAPPSTTQPAPSPPEELDTFDYGDEDDDEARLASQARRLEEQSRKLEAEKEAAAIAAKNDNRASTPDSRPSKDKAPASDPNESDLHRFGFVRHPDQSNVPAGMVRVLSCVLYLGGLSAGLQEEQLRAQIGSFGKIDDIRIVNGPVADAAFVRYIDREEAESAKNLVRSYFSEYKVGWGKGVGVNKDDFDTRQGIGMVPEASLVRTQKPTLPARPQAALESHSARPAPGPPAAHSSVSSTVRPWHASQQQPPPNPTSSWNGMAAPSVQPSQMMPPYGSVPAPTPPRSIGSVPASWDGGASAPISSSWDLKPSGPPSRSGWDVTPTPSSLSNAPSGISMDSSWGHQTGVTSGDRQPSSTVLSSSSWDGRSSQAPSWDNKPQHGRGPAPSSTDVRSHAGDRSDRPGVSSWDSKRRPGGPRSSGFDPGPSSVRDQRGSSSFDKESSCSWNKGPASRDPPPRGSSFSNRPPQSTGHRDNNSSSGPSWADSSSSARGSNNPSSGPSWGDTSSSGPSWGDIAPAGRESNNPSLGPSWGDASSSGPSWGDSTSGKGGAPSCNPPKEENPGRANNSSWDGSNDNQGRGNNRFSSAPPRGGDRRCSDNDRRPSGSDHPRPWNHRDGDRDNKDSDSRRRNRDSNFRGPPRNDRDGGDRPPRNNNGNDFKGGRGNGPRGRDNRDNNSWSNGNGWGGSAYKSQSDNSSQAGSANNSQSDSGGWARSAGSNQSSTGSHQSSSSWGDQPSSGTAWDSTPSAGASWAADTKPSGNGTGDSGGWQDSSSKSAGDSKRSREEVGWGSVPADDNGNNKKTRNDGW